MADEVIERLKSPPCGFENVTVSKHWGTGQCLIAPSPLPLIPGSEPKHHTERNYSGYRSILVGSRKAVICGGERIFRGVTGDYLDLGSSHGSML